MSGEVMYDSTTASDIPPAAVIVAGYVDGEHDVECGGLGSLREREEAADRGDLHRRGRVPRHRER